MATTASAQENSIQQTIYPYIQLIIRRKWIIIFGALPVLIAGLLYCLLTPLTYKASTLIVMVPQKVPESYVRSTVTGHNEERVRGILQEIVSRTNLEKMIKKFDLYPKLRKKLPMESVVEIMRENIHIENPREARKNAFTLSFEGGDPRVITKVTNALANMFIEQNLKLRETQSQNTAQFLANQLDKIYVELKKREEALKRYKLTHMGELPEQYKSNLATLNSLQMRLQDIQENIRRAQDRKLLLQQQLADQRAALNMMQSHSVDKSDETDLRGGMSLAELKRRLKILQSRYTDQHPDIVALKKAIAEQEKLQQLRGRGNSYSRQQPILTGNPAIDALKLQIRSTDLEINDLKRAKQKVESEIMVYQRRIENTPRREQELVDLTRDYENLKQTYDDLLQKKLQAEQAAALERRQQGEQFKIIDPARIPEKPIRPNLQKMIPLIILLALCFSFGLAFLVDMMSNKIFDPDEIRKMYGLEILACIPVLLSDEEIRKRRKKIALLVLTATAGYGFVFFLAALLYIHGPGSYAGII